MARGAFGEQMNDKKNKCKLENTTYYLWHMTGSQLVLGKKCSLNIYSLPNTCMSVFRYKFAYRLMTRCFSWISLTALFDYVHTYD